jgi:hypothetical protein
LSEYGIGIASNIPEEVNLVKGYVTFNNAIKYLQEKFKEYYWDDSSDLTTLEGPNEAIQSFINNLGIDQEIKNDLKDFINIQKYLNNSSSEYYDSSD